MQYSVVNEHLDDDGGTTKFVAKVTSAIADGWEPVGAPFPMIIANGRGTHKLLYQAMSKHDWKVFPGTNLSAGDLNSLSGAVAPIASEAEIARTDKDEVQNLIDIESRDAAKKSGNAGPGETAMRSPEKEVKTISDGLVTTKGFQSKRELGLTK